MFCFFYPKFCFPGSVRELCDDLHGCFDGDFDSLDDAAGVGVIYVDGNFNLPGPGFDVQGGKG